jgi:hypothetical protein
MTRVLVRVSLVVASLVTLGACSATSVSRAAYEQSYLAGRFNWSFRRRFPEADRLLNAFDYGHAALYQTLITRDDARVRLDGPEFDFITTDLLRHPPNLAVDEAAIGPDYAKLAPELVALFDWAHVLHRQLYDVWSANGVTDQWRDAAVARILAYYRSRPDLALSTRPKSMALMESQPYSRVFRRNDPKYNGLLWSYHWFQLALYDDLIGARTDVERQSRVDSTVHRFFAMIADAPRRMPAEMPMAPTAAPVFAARYPEAAIVFDNLHALHDVVADILMSPAVPRVEKRAALLAAAAVYRNDTTEVVSVQEWRQMARMMAVPERP